MTEHDTSLEPLPIWLLRELFEIADYTRNAINDLLAELDLTEPMVEVLWVLAPDGPPVSMRDLAHRLRCDPSNVTLLSNRLERAGLAVRAPHPSDGRSRVLQLTERGRAVWTDLVRTLENNSPVFSALDPAERRQLNDLLIKITTRIARNRRPLAHGSH